MFKTIQQFFDLWFAYPIVALIVTIGLGVFIWKYRKQLMIILEKKLGIKSSNPLEFYSVKSGEFFDFGEEQIISCPEDFYNSLNKRIKKLKKQNRYLKINLAKMKQYNVYFEEVIRDHIREMVITNNIQCKVIFPYKGMSKLYDELDEFIKERNSHSVELQKAKRTRK